jgi:hypothetical protein
MNQFLHLGAFGRQPRKGERQWSCIVGVCAEAARLPQACGHLPYRAEPNLLHGVSPIEAGRIAEERANQAFDATGKRRLRKDGIALLAGVASYPVPRADVNQDPVDHTYGLWRQKSIDWLRVKFGAHLLSIVEHVDEAYLHLHFYVVPWLDESTKRLNVDVIHPGHCAKRTTLAAGASHKEANRAYRRAMSAFQDDYHRAVSVFFGHDRYGPKRARVGRREREMQKRLEERQARLDAELDAKAAEFERELARRRAEFDGECAQLAADVKQGSWQTYAKPYADLRAAYTALKARLADAQARYSAEIAALRERLAELEPLAAAGLAA